jgi:HAD superfamily hydrolase (TIGR01509 family)
MNYSGNGDKISTLSSLDLKAFLFDMDGVLFDSMPGHAKAWVYALEQQGVKFDEYGAYMREGMTGASTINDVFQLQLGRSATEEECKEIYKIKSDYFDTFEAAKPMPYAIDVLQTVKNAGLDIFIVTGSGQSSLLNTLNDYFPGFFQRKKIVTALDVKKGKPDPEPYLMALQKGNLKPNQAVVIENAPLGVRSAVGAGIFTIAVNTGILKNEELTNNGANLVYKDMKSLYEELLIVMNDKVIK